MGDNRIDFGDGHWGEFFQWAPDRKLNPQYALLPDVPYAGLMMHHPAPEGAKCGGAGAVTFRQDAEHPLNRGALWTVLSLDPLTIDPSVYCNPEKGGCGDHGWIRDGRWVRAG